MGRPRAIERETVDAVALDLFLARGFEVVTAQDIATACGISRPTLYRLVPTMADIVLDQIQTAIDAILERLATSEATGWEALREAFVDAMSAAITVPAQAKALLVVQRNSEIRALAVSSSRTIRRGFTDVLIARGDFDGDPGDCELAAACAIATLQVVLAREGATQDDLDRSFRRAARVLG